MKNIILTGNFYEVKDQIKADYKNNKENIFEFPVTGIDEFMENISSMDEIGNSVRLKKDTDLVLRVKDTETGNCIEAQYSKFNNEKELTVWYNDIQFRSLVPGYLAGMIGNCISIMFSQTSTIDCIRAILDYKFFFNLFDCSLDGNDVLAFDYNYKRYFIKKMRYDYYTIRCPKTREIVTIDYKDNRGEQLNMLLGIDNTPAGAETETVTEQIEQSPAEAGTVTETETETENQYPAGENSELSTAPAEAGTVTATETATETAQDPAGKTDIENELAYFDDGDSNDTPVKEKDPEDMTREEKIAEAYDMYFEAGFRYDMDEDEIDALHRQVMREIEELYGPIDPAPADPEPEPEDNDTDTPADTAKDKDKQAEELCDWLFEGDLSEGEITKEDMKTIKKYMRDNAKGEIWGWVKENKDNPEKDTPEWSYEEAVNFVSKELEISPAVIRDCYDQEDYMAYTYFTYHDAMEFLQLDK